MVPVVRRRSSRRSYGSYHTGQRHRVYRAPRGYSRARLTCVFGVLLAAAGLIGGLGAATPTGAGITAAVVRFLLFYGGVFALVALTATVGFGLVATDRIIMMPGHRVAAQAIHRAVSLAALTFLVIHIVLEIAAERSRAADAVVPFLAHGRTFYIGLGTVASDLILVIVASGFLRQRFATSRRPWLWRATHASAYLAWLLSILHGLLGGRTAKPYVDWSYGACVAMVALALGIRLVATSRSKQEVALSAGEAAQHPGWPALPADLTYADRPQLPIARHPAARAGLPPGPGPAPDPRGGRYLSGHGYPPDRPYPRLPSQPALPAPPAAAKKGGDLPRRIRRSAHSYGGPR